MTFEELGLLPELLKAIREEGYETPTPVQAQAIPQVLAGRDLIAGAQTGTGKTAAFTLPMLQRLAPKATDLPAPSKHPIRALILTPTRELAMQVEESVRTYGRHLPLRSTTIFGGVSINPQIRALKAGVEILVATPGRLLDHHHQGSLDFRQLEILVLDEADRMLDMGFINDIKKILALLPPGRQNLLFSATYSDEIHTLASRLLKDPAQVEVARRNAEAELVTHVVHPVDKDRKKLLLAHLITERAMFQVLVFTRTKHGANHLATFLQRSGISAAPIHGDRSQNQRVRALADFKAAKIQALVATDIAARGLDIDQLPHVINFELPQVAEDYVHRSGRTGRAGAAGEAISLVSPDEHDLLRDIEKLLKKPLPKAELPGWEVDPTKPVEPRPVPGQRGRQIAEARRAAESAHVDGNAGERPAREGRPSRDPRQGREGRQSREGRADTGRPSGHPHAPNRSGNRQPAPAPAARSSAKPSPARHHNPSAKHGPAGFDERGRSREREPLAERESQRAAAVKSAINELLGGSFPRRGR
jgi:ATP-dependent RNA helicase RhlE